MTEKTDNERITEADSDNVHHELRNTIKKLPPDDQKKIKHLISASHYQGPIPPADMMAQYEQVLPGSADRILAMTEKQLEHQISMQNKQVTGSVKDARLGLWLGFLIALACITGGTIIAVTTSAGVGVTVIFGSIAALVGVFVYGSRGERPPKEEKRASGAKRSRDYRSDGASAREQETLDQKASDDE